MTPHTASWKEAPRSQVSSVFVTVPSIGIVQVFLCECIFSLQKLASQYLRKRLSANLFMPWLKEKPMNFVGKNGSYGV